MAVQLTRKVRARLRVAEICVVALWVWPLIQHALVVTMDIDPWKFFGFAMYCTPHQVQVLITREDGPVPLPVDYSRFSEPTRKRIFEFARDRQTLGKFVDPKPVMGAILQEAPDIRSLALTVVLHRLDPHTSQILPSWHTYRVAVGAFSRQAHLDTN